MGRWAREASRRASGRAAGLRHTESTGSTFSTNPRVGSTTSEHALCLTEHGLGLRDARNLVHVAVDLLLRLDSGVVPGGALRGVGCAPSAG